MIRLRLSVLFSVIFLLLSCRALENPTKLDPEGKITSPYPHQVYKEELPLLFTTNSLQKDLLWHSSIDQNLDSRSSFTSYLSPGEHIITLSSAGKKIDALSLEVKPLPYLPGGYYRMSLNQRENTRLLPAGNYHPLIVSLGYSPIEIGLQDFSVSSPLGRSLAPAEEEEDDFLDKKRGILLPHPSLPAQRFPRPQRRSILQDEDLPLSPQSFFLVNTSDSSDKIHRIMAKLLYESEELELWLDEESKKNEDKLYKLWKEITSHGFPRVKALWGEGYDVDGDGKRTILISPKINEDGSAVGFFNPADFYEYNNDKDSELYNPSSNEGDILYLADPSGPLGKDANEFTYSVATLQATFCHEYYHFFSFSKVFQRIVDKLEYRHEQRFLEEGLAHLTENLCGYGKSGGNLLFLDRYLENPDWYSLSYEDSVKESDSNGRRGAVAAFLSWLFWKEGGLEWDETEVDSLKDVRGMDFLRRFHSSSSHSGWQNISFAMEGKNAKTSLQDWFRYLNDPSRAVTERYPDPITEEELQLLPFHGDVTINGKEYSLNGPKRIDPTGEIFLLPYSALWLSATSLQQKSFISIAGEEDKGYVIADFLMPQE